MGSIEALDSYKDRYEFGVWLNLDKDGGFIVEAHPKKFRHIFFRISKEALMESDLLQDKDKAYLEMQKTNPDFLPGWKTFAYAKGRTFFNLAKEGK